MVAAGTDTLHRIDLNIPSVDATTMAGSISTQRTAINVSGKNQTLDAQISAPAGVTITVNNGKAIKVHKGASVTFPIEIDAPSVANGQYQGRINLVPRKGANKVTIPVAFVKKQGAVTLSNTCSPLSFVASTSANPTSTHCTATRCELLAAVGQRCSEHLGVGCGQAQGPHLQERRPAGLGHRLG